jgi:large subunit ribosomal protein L3
MIHGLLGKKLGMIRIFSDMRVALPVTVLQIGPCRVTQKKVLENDGYEAVQIGFGPIKDSKANKPLKGHVKASGGTAFAHIQEFGVESIEDVVLGQDLTVELFHVGDSVNVIGHSKGRGFAGVIKRWGFGGGRATHGCTSHRIPGSIGSSSTPSKVVKGKKLPGHMGNRKVTVKNLEVIDIRPEENLLLVKGSVPGPTGGLVSVIVAGKREGVQAA